MYLCKWSPIKFFMYLWLTILIWIFTGCQSAYTMHLSPFSSHYINNNNNNNNNNYLQQQLQEYSNNNFRHNLTKNEAYAINYSSSSSSSNSNRNNEPNYDDSILSSRNSDKLVNKKEEEDEENARDLWMVRMQQKRQTRLAHRKQLRLLRSINHHQNLPNPVVAGRNRRNSPKNSHHYPSHHNYHHNYHHNQPHHQQQQQQQQQPVVQTKPVQNNGPKRYCSARDPQTLAFIAPIVFEGKVKSQSRDRRTIFSVTFEVIYIHKRISDFMIPTNVRLQFSKNNSECDIYRETYRERGYVRDELEQGQVYFLFVQQVSIGNFTILGQPIKKNKKTLKAVESVVSENYGQHASIVSISRNITVQEGKPVRLVCKVRGQPPPKVTWYKERNPITRNNKNNKYTLVHLKKRSELTIRSAEPNDSGMYECRARNKFAKQSVSNFTKVKITPRPTTRHTLGKGKNSASGGLCPPGVSDMFCYNGGTCLLFESIKEPACQCPDGFTGMKCETKYSSVSQTLPSAPKAEDCNKKFHGGYYC